MEEAERLRALQLELEAAGILPARRRTIMDRLGPILSVVASLLVAGGLGLTAILLGWFASIFLF